VTSRSTASEARSPHAYMTSSIAPVAQGAGSVPAGAPSSFCHFTPSQDVGQALRALGARRSAVGSRSIASSRRRWR